MYYVMYNVLLLLFSPVILGLLLTKKRCQRGIQSRLLGFIPGELRHLQKPVIWVHAVSLGEVTAIVPLLLAIQKRYPQWPLMVSTVTETGREVVLDRLKGVAVHCYAPLDFWWSVNRFVRVLKPHLFILVESEFWPNLLNSLHRHQVPVCLVNGRISSQSFARYTWIQGMMKRVLNCIDVSLMQSEVDAKRLSQLGAMPGTVHVTGNMKFDQALMQDNPIGAAAVPTLRSSLKIQAAEMLIVAGSTHPHEEEYLLETYKAVVRRHPQVVLLLAPRHIERASKLEQVIRDYGFSCIRRSRTGESLEDPVQGHGPRVILLDTRGELPYFYREGYLTFVGGTLVPVGGHNLIEPAQWGKPVLFGPYVDHCRDTARLLLQANGGIQVQDQHELEAQILYLIAHSAEVEDRGRRAFEVVQTHRGVIDRNLKWIDRLLEKKDSLTVPLPVAESSATESQNILR
jgi:3-deoxy-D-manno-octulosonic-acid transferase